MKRSGSARPNAASLLLALALYLSGSFGLAVLINGAKLLDHPAIAALLPAPLLHLAGGLQGMSPAARTALAIPFMTLSAAFVELAFVGWEHSALQALLRRERHVSRDFGYLCLMLITRAPLLAALGSFGLSYLFLKLLAGVPALPLHHFLPWVVLQVLFLILLRSLAEYWDHRLSHAVPALWQLHKVHHSATEMTLLSFSRDTSLTHVLAHSLTPLAGALFIGLDAGKSQVQTMAAGVFLLAYGTALEVHRRCYHSAWDSSWGWFGRYLYVSPAYHRLHHCALPQYYNCNFSIDLVMWDRIFGTYVDPELVPERGQLPLGFDDNRYDHRSLAYDYLLRPSLDFLHNLCPPAIRNRLRGLRQPA